jgi:hypothetical protein
MGFVELKKPIEKTALFKCVVTEKVLLCLFQTSITLLLYLPLPLAALTTCDQR